MFFKHRFPKGADTHILRGTIVYYEDITVSNLVHGRGVAYSSHVWVTNCHLCCQLTSQDGHSSLQIDMLTCYVRQCNLQTAPADTFIAYPVISR